MNSGPPISNLPRPRQGTSPCCGRFPPRATAASASISACPRIATTSREPASAIENNAYFERWQVSCDGGLKGKTITIDGLRSTLTDVLARISWADGSVEVERLTPEQPR